MSAVAEGASPPAAVVICTYASERWDDLVAAVRSVAAQVPAPAQIVVVVDHNDGLLARARRELIGATVVANTEPRGLAGARNTGVAASRGHVVAFLDDDALAAEGWLGRLLEGYVDRGVLGVGGAVEPLWLAGRPRAFPQEFDWVVGCTYRGMPVTPAAVRNLIGANMSFRRDVLERAGGFRSGLGRIGRVPLGCEETELCLRAARAHPGGRFLYDPRARVHHRVPPARARLRYFGARCFAEGRSKAMVSRLAGRAPALATERAYATRTLPGAVARGLADSLWRGDPAGVARAAAVVAGLAATTAGFVVESVSREGIRR